MALYDNAAYTGVSPYDTVFAAPPSIVNENIFNFKQRKRPNQNHFVDSVAESTNSIEVTANVRKAPDKFKIQPKKKIKSPKWSGRKQKTESNHCNDELKLVQSEELFDESSKVDEEVTTEPIDDTISQDNEEVESTSSTLSGVDEASTGSVASILTTEIVFASTLDATTETSPEPTVTVPSTPDETSSEEALVQPVEGPSPTQPTTGEKENLIAKPWPYDNYNHNPLINFIHLTTTMVPWKGHDTSGTIFKPSKKDVTFDFIPINPGWA